MSEVLVGPGEELGGELHQGAAAIAGDGRRRRRRPPRSSTRSSARGGAEERRAAWLDARSRAAPPARREDPPRLAVLAGRRRPRLRGLRRAGRRASSSGAGTRSTARSIDRRGARPRRRRAAARATPCGSRVRRRPDVVFAPLPRPRRARPPRSRRCRAARRSSSWPTARTWRTRSRAAPSARRRASSMRRAHTVIFNSAYLRDRSPLRAPSAARGHRLRRRPRAFAAPTRPRRARRSASGRRRPVLLFVGQRSSSARTSCACATRSRALGRGTLVVVGDGPLRGELEGRPGIRLAGRVPHDESPRWIAAADVVCLPSLVEPLGQVAARGDGQRALVVATRVAARPSSSRPRPARSSTRSTSPRSSRASTRAAALPLAEPGGARRRRGARRAPPGRADGGGPRRRACCGQP